MSSIDVSSPLSPEGKDSKDDGGTCNELFDFDFVLYDQDSLDSSDNSNGSNLFDDLGLSSSSNDAVFVDYSTFPAPASRQRSQLRPWSRQRSPPVPKTRRLVHQLRRDGVAISSTELLSIEGKSRSSCPEPLVPASPPVTPPLVKNHRQTAPLSPTRRTQGALKVTPNRVANGSPKIMHPSSYYSERGTASFFEWQERFQRFNLQSRQTDFPPSPPPSSKPPQDPQFPCHALLTHDGPISAPTVASGRAGNAYAEGYAGFEMNHLHGLARPRTDPNYGIEFNFEPPRWDGISFLEPQAEQDNGPASGVFTSTAHGLPLESSFGTEGLMISCEPFDDTGSAGLYGGFPPGSAIVDGEGTSDVLPGTHSPQQRHDISTLHSPSPNPFPRKSPSTSSRKHHRTRARTRGKSSTPRTPRTPRAPKATSNGNGGSFSLGFVNFTPDDSQKILTGVAPSGSSKTKARREREASERRRRLSEAAARVVREAGGDIDALIKEGLLV
jgi:hypothetical protein